MKRRVCLSLPLIAIAGVLVAQQKPLAVPDEATAVKIAERALKGIYGEKTIQSEEPFTASLAKGVWHVVGTLYCTDQQGKRVTDGCVGGTAQADIRQSDGRVLKTGHTK
jgi:hypothetical protein